jgi:protein-disulfide isomerase
MLDHRVSPAPLPAAASPRAAGSRGAAPAANGPAPVAMSASATASATASGVGVVAEVNGTPILASELDSRTSSRLARLRQEEYEIRQQALDELIAERLLGAEAGKRGISRDELLRLEVDARTPKVASSEVEGLYEQNKTRFASEPKDVALARIREILGQRANGERRQAYLQELRAKARVAVRLEVPRTRVDLPADAPSIGPASAAVTIVEFTDYQCPYCHRAQSVMDEILARYKGKVRLVHLSFPLEGHPGALPAAKAARCAGEQGKFQEYHHGLMTDSGVLDDADLKARAAKLGLKAADFDACLASNRYEAVIRASFEQGASLGVSGTPAYFVNGRLLSGARPYEEFARVIDAELGAR